MKPNRRSHEILAAVALAAMTAFWVWQFVNFLAR